MAIYKMVGDKERLALIQETSFNNESVKEVEDLQRLILEQPEILEQGLFVISAEFSEWRDSNRRIDLLAIDDSGRLVVIELKRGQTGDHSELQAIRYAAMVANLTFDKIAGAYQSYFGESEEEFRVKLSDHLGFPEDNEVELDTAKPRIILACEGFSKELTTSVLWLNGCDLDIKCVRLKPYRMGDDLLVETSQIIPLPEAAEFTEQFRERERENRIRKTRGRGWMLLGEEDAFKDTFTESREDFRPGLNRLYDAAATLKKENLVELQTYINGSRNNVKLHLFLPGTKRYPVSFSNLLFQEGTGEINFWPDWHRFSPNSRARIDQLIGAARSTDGVRHRRLSTTATFNNLDEILSAVREAYREANGLLTSEEGA